jgi:hypothetical protein
MPVTYPFPMGPDPPSYSGMSVLDEHSGQRCFREVVLKVHHLRVLLQPRIMNVILFEEVSYVVHGVMKGALGETRRGFRHKEPHWEEEISYDGWVGSYCTHSFASLCLGTSWSCLACVCVGLFVGRRRRPLARHRPSTPPVMVPQPGGSLSRTSCIRRANVEPLDRRTRGGRIVEVVVRAARDDRSFCLPQRPSSPYFTRSSFVSEVRDRGDSAG